MISWMTKMNPAEHVWNELLVQNERPIFRRVDESHPFDLYFGVELNNAPVLMLLSVHQAQELPTLKALEISQNLRQDGRFALLVRLADPDLFNPFSSVCQDLIESLRDIKSESEEPTFLVNRLEKWRRLLEPRRKGLTESEIRGLIGELLFLEKLIMKCGEVQAVEAWLGPEGAPQDFQLQGCLYEVKTCTVGSHVTKITSLEQLHTSGAPTYLIVLFVATAAEGQNGAFCLNDLVLRLRDRIVTNAASAIFELKLTELGFDEGQVECNSKFLFEKARSFHVTEAFPRLTPTQVPAAVASATYCLDLDQCAEFEISYSQVLEA